MQKRRTSLWRTQSSKNNTHRSRTAPGFSIVELVLFIGVVGLMGGAIVSFSILSDQVRVQNDIVAEVEQNAAAFLAAFTREVQNADLIVHPALDATDSSVLLATESPAREVLIFQDPNGRARIVENGTTVTFMTTAGVGIRNLSFLHFGEANVREGVTVTFEAYNMAKGTSIDVDQYTKNYWGTSAPRISLCGVDGDCPGVGDVCCSGICKASGTDCTDPECVTVDDCTTDTPSCTSGGSSCTLNVPYCRRSDNTCQTYQISGACDTCVIVGNTQCNDGLDNDFDALIDTDDPGCHTDGNAANAASYNPADNVEADSTPGCDADVAAVNCTPTTVLIDNNTTAYYNDNLGSFYGDRSQYMGVWNDRGGQGSMSEIDISIMDSELGPWITNPATIIDNLSSYPNWSGPMCIPSKPTAGWVVTEERAIIYKFDAGAGLTDIYAYFGADNGIYVWLDGVFIHGWESFVGSSALDKYFHIPSLSPGFHYLSIFLNDESITNRFEIMVNDCLYCLNQDMMGPNPIDDPVPANGCNNNFFKCGLESMCVGPNGLESSAGLYCCRYDRECPGNCAKDTFGTYSADPTKCSVGTCARNTGGDTVNTEDADCYQCSVYQCNDGIDNDGDGGIDSADPGCHSDNNASDASSYRWYDDDESDTQWTTFTEYCGNGLVEGSEECDDGNWVNDDSCSGGCKTLPTSCPSCDDNLFCTNDDTSSCPGSCGDHDFYDPSTQPEPCRSLGIAAGLDFDNKCVSPSVCSCNQVYERCDYCIFDTKAECESSGCPLAVFNCYPDFTLPKWCCKIEP